jgi:hypothetical protein
MKRNRRPLPFGEQNANEHLHTEFRSIMNQPPGGLHGAEV